MISTADFRKGLKIEIEGEPFVMVDFQHVKPGKGGAFVRTKVKSLLSGNVLEKTFRSGEKFNVPDLTERSMQFLYKEGDSFVFMDCESYDQTYLTGEVIGDDAAYIKDGMTINVLSYREQPIGITLPTFVNLQVTKADPGIRGDTASGGSKPATLETGAVIQVPLFVSEGDMIRIDTRSGEYIERVSSR